MATRNPEVECQTHGWQSSILYTRYERRSKPRDVADLYVCSVCSSAQVTPDEANSVRTAPDAAPS